MAIIGQDRIILWFQPDGPGTPMSPFGVGEKAGGMSGKTVPGPGRSPIYGRTEFGAPVVIKVNREAPGDLPNATITLYERAQVNILLEALQKGCPINIQTRIVKCGALNNPNNWDVIEHWGQGEVTSYNPGDGPVTEFAGDALTVEGSVSFTHYIYLVNTVLSRLTTTETEDFLSIAGIPDEDCNICGNGYPGADSILYFGAASDGVADANLWYTRNGGGSIQVVSTLPWAAGNQEDVSFVAARPVSQTQLRVVAATSTTVAGVKAGWKYADVNYGSEGTISAWNDVTIAATATGDVVTAMAWLGYSRLYAAVATDIYLSEDQGVTDPGAAVYSGSDNIVGFAKSPDESEYWAFGENNLILRQLEEGDVFEERVGPTGGGAFSALVVAGDGTIYAGNGTSIYRNTDKANDAGNWEELRDFGTNKSVIAIQAIGGQRALGGDSQLLRAVVDDTVGTNSGLVYQSVDGGSTWFQIQELTNNGYNQAYFSEINDNLAYVVGDTYDPGAGTEGQIHRLAPKN